MNKVWMSEEYAEYPDLVTLRQAAEKGDMFAQAALANYLSEPENSDQDMPAAIMWSKRAYQQGDGVAAFNLGKIYRDLNKPRFAFRWYQIALQTGQDNDAALDIGLCYLLGFGVKQNFNAAYQSFTYVIEHQSTVCQRSTEDAYYWLAFLNLMQLGTNTPSIHTARQMLSIADADADHEAACNLLQIIGRVMPSK